MVLHGDRHGPAAQDKDEAFKRDTSCGTSFVSVQHTKVNTNQA